MKNQSSYQILPEMEIFADTYKGQDKAPMKYLYFSDNMNELQETIAKLAFVCIMQDVPKIVPEDVMQVAMATMLENTCEHLKYYASFTAWINPNFTENDYYTLYQESFKYYFDNVKGMMEDFALDQEDWKKGFEGCLFID